MTGPYQRCHTLTPLPLQGVVRVVRELEEEAEHVLAAGGLVYVSAPRKSGKTTLARRLEHRFRNGEAGFSCLTVWLTLTNLDEQPNVEAFTHNLKRRQEDTFEDLARAAKLSAQRKTELRAAHTHGDWLWRVASEVAVEVAARVVIFVDEVEELSGKYRQAGEPWLIGLRQAHQDADGRIGVCVLGRLPARLLVLSPERTPFNTAREIRLPDFTRDEVACMVRSAFDTRFEEDDLARVIARAVVRQTGGQPHLTQCLLKRLQDATVVDPEAIADYAVVIREFVERDDECQPTRSKTYMGIDRAFGPGPWPAEEGLEVYALMLESVSQLQDDALPATEYDPWNEGHEMLEALGLARVEHHADGRSYLTVRNPIVRRIFNEDWVARRRLGLPSATGPASAGVLSRALVQMEEVAQEEICGGDWARVHGARLVPGSGREVVEGALFEFELVREKPNERLTLQMFRGAGSLARRLWTDQVRTLRRVSDLSEALPAIYRGSVLERSGAAYIITHRPAMTLADAGVYEFIRERRAWALDQFASLARGLGELAAEGIVHRGIWPGTIRMDAPEADGRGAQMKFANFEFSVMLRSVVGVGNDLGQVVAERRAALRKAYLRQPTRARPYAPPEFLAGIFAGSHEPLSATVTTGVFGLGLLVTTWFLGPLDAEGFTPVLREESGDAAYSAEDHFAYIAGLQAAVRRGVSDGRVPAVLGGLLEEMIHPDPGDRPTPDQVVKTLEANAPVLRAWALGSRKPLLVCYSYRQTAERLADAGFITSAVDTEASRRDVEAFLERELRHATLFHAPLGVAPYVDAPEREHHTAQWVLKGPTWLFYCQRFERRGRGLAAAAQTPHILRIAYPWPQNRLWRGLPTESVRVADFGPLRIVEQQSSPEMDRELDANYQSWDPVLGSASRRLPPPSFEIAKTAFSWLVESQKEALELQRFPVRKVGDSKGRTSAYQLDEKAYRRWVAQNSVRSMVFQASGISDPREYFEQILQEAWSQGDREVRLRVRSGDGFQSRWSSVKLEEVSAAAVKLSGPQLPPEAQIEVRSVFLGLRPLVEQSAAIDELARRPGLFDQLLQPHAIIDQDGADDVDLARSVERLAGRAPEIVRRIVASSPLVTLQGPPGTGKTTVTTAVIEALLRRDPTQRILVTSQSHAAVDNIALRIKELELVERDQMVCLRVAADEHFEKGAKIDEQLWPWRPEATVERLAGRIRKACENSLATPLEPEQRRAYAQLKHAASTAVLELADRARSGANLVFATTAGSRRAAREGFLPHGRFDMAIVDEASKAWPTEIIQPMLLADRYLLVGDHRQLPAFGAASLEQMLQHCVLSRREEFQVFANNGGAIRAWLRLFESFYVRDENLKFVGVGERDQLPGWRDGQAVAEQLDVQFRMRGDIARVVSRGFYRDELKSAPSVDERPRSAWLDAFAEDIGAKRGILWLDTQPLRFFRNQAPGLNEDQAELAARLLRHASRLAGSADVSRAVALSPYNRQNSEITQRLAAHDSGLRNNVHTVDSFQGREAELVILSLVRGPGADRDGGSPTARYGFLVQPERVNVMFSRARDLLVVLGDFDFFAQAETVRRRNNPRSPFDLSFWQRVCDQVMIDGQVVDPADLPPALQLR